MGNHDHYHNASADSKAALIAAGTQYLDNSGIYLKKNGQRVWLAGVGDLWRGKVDYPAALKGSTEKDAVILMSHNPDFAEDMVQDERVSLVLSGHTHGGQVVFPLFGAPYVPSGYGQKYLHGLVQAPFTQVYISRGLGTVNPPVRFLAPPEIVDITLASAAG